jgi:hypothetical protein
MRTHPKDIHHGTGPEAKANGGLAMALLACQNLLEYIAMNKNVSRRTMLALAGAGAVSMGSLRAAPVFAQGGTTSPHTFRAGAELTWVDPWTKYEESFVEEFLPDSAAFQSDGKAELVVGYYEASTGVDDAVASLLALIVQDPAASMEIAGGSGRWASPEGAQKSSEHRVHCVGIEGVAWGLYTQVLDGRELTALVSPVDTFASELESVQASVMINGKGVLGGANGADLQQQLEIFSHHVIQPAEISEYTDGTGYVHVTWTGDWVELSYDEVGIELTNPAESIVVTAQGYFLEGMTLAEMLEVDIAWMSDDQGADAELFGPVETGDGYVFATDGTYGLRLVQLKLSANPDVYVFMRATFPDAKGAEAIALLEEAQTAIRVNGEPVLQGLEGYENF